MKEPKSNINSQSKQDIKILAFPVLGLFVLTFLAIFMFTNLYPRILVQNNQRESTMETIAVLKDKEAILRSASASVETLTDDSVLALPDKTSALTMLSQLKKLAEENNLSVVKNTISSENAYTEDIHAVNASISIEANQMEEIAGFLSGISGLAPLSQVERVSLKEEDNLIAATVELSVYWSPFPKELPALDAPISSLSPSEQKLLTELSSLRSPEFVIVAPSNPEARENPFN